MAGIPLLLGCSADLLLCELFPFSCCSLDGDVLLRIVGFSSRSGYHRQKVWGCPSFWFPVDIRLLPRVLWGNRKKLG